MKNIYYQNKQILWDGANVYHSNGIKAWDSKLEMARYPNEQIAIVYNKCFWKNGEIAWDGEIGQGYHDDGLPLTNFGVAIELNNRLTILCDKEKLELKIKMGRYQNDVSKILIKY
ncbi:hypothetical protein ACKUSY_05590 [Myroides odoratus]